MSMENEKSIIVECAYASKNEQVLLVLKVKQGSTIADVIKLSGLLERFPELHHEIKLEAGIFGRLKQLSDTVSAGDRIEIYRPLFINPMEARRQRAPAPKRRKY